MTSAAVTTEATLCRILAEVLDLDLVRPQDGFFEAGGDSVLAVQFVARAREAGLVLTVRDLFDHQTAQTLAAAIGDASVAATASDALAPVESPLLTLADDEFGEFGDIEVSQSASVAEDGWETPT